jgi:hypothetical protein
VFGKGTGVAPSLWPPETFILPKYDNGTILSLKSECKGQATRPISTAQLHTLPCFHLQPINVVVFDGSVGIAPGSAHLEVGFPLRCIQRLSSPHIATQLCRWRDNWCTRGASIPVLSYWGQLLATLQRPRKIRTELSHDVLNPARVPL